MRLHVGWDLQIEGFSEHGEDEVALQFALLTVMDDQVRLTPHNTMNLFPGSFRTGIILPPGSLNDDGERFRAAGRIVTRNVPTLRNPYLGFVARAVEYDSSGDRGGDNARFFNAIEEASQAVVDNEGLPDTTDLWTAGNGAGLRDHWFTDDDDKVSTSVRAFPEFGSRNAEAEAAEREAVEAGTEFPPGHPLPGPEEEFGITFVGADGTNAAGALYQTQVSIRLVANGGPTTEQSWY